MFRKICKIKKKFFGKNLKRLKILFSSASFSMYVKNSVSEMRLKNLLCSETSRFIYKIHLICPHSSHALVSLILKI